MKLADLLLDDFILFAKSDGKGGFVCINRLGKKVTLPKGFQRHD